MSNPDLTPGGNTLTDWSYAATVEASGGVLYGVVHDGYPFAERVGLIKSYARIRDPAGGRTFVPFDLGAEGMRLGDHMQVSPAREPSPDLYYQLSHRISSQFDIQDFMGTGQRLLGHQAFGFTESSSSPRHETVGIATASRFYPSIHFGVNRRRSGDDEAVDLLRFDFWFEPDSPAGGRRSALPGVHLLQSIVRSFTRDLNARVPQQAGLFRDRDRAVTTRLVQSRGIGGPGEQIFSAAEKPLIWEVSANGILNGGTEGWDNIHIWGHSRDGLVSTPGMPFGIHFHWRWAAATTNPAAMVFGNWTPRWLRAPELAGRDAEGNMVPGGPLIDPRTPDTDLRLAVVTKSAAEAYAQRAATHAVEFADIFSDRQAQPARIADGEDLVVIVSIVLRRPALDRDWHSTVFPHGFFYSHVYDTGPVNEAMLAGAGAYSSQYITARPRRGWHRNPQ